MYSSGISELVLVVKDVLSSARFYEEVVGLMPEKEVDDEWAWFWAGSMDIRGHDLTNTKKYREIARSGRAARF